MYYLIEDIFNISYFRKRSYVFGIQAIFQVLFHLKYHILWFFYMKFKCNKCSSNDQYLTIYLSSMLYFHKVFYHNEFLNHTKYMVYVCLSGLKMLKSNGSYLYGDIGGIFFQTFYFHNIVNIDEIHILYVVILFHVIFSLQHPCVGTLTMMY